MMSKEGSTMCAVGSTRSLTLNLSMLRTGLACAHVCRSLWDGFLRLGRNCMLESSMCEGEL